MTDPLAPDCTRCAALCCVVLGFQPSADFPVHKAPGTACPNLGPDHRCTIHARLRPEGFVGCAVYDCFGAGQHLTASVLRGGSWRDQADTVPGLVRALPQLRGLHQLRWHLREATRITEPAATELLATLRDLDAELAEAAGAPLPDLLTTELAAWHARVAPALREAAWLHRRQDPGPELDGADLVGLDLRPHRLRGASLRGALLLGADLRGMDLSLADLTGADLRGARLEGTLLDQALFVHPAQLAAAHPPR